MKKLLLLALLSATTASAGSVRFGVGQVTYDEQSAHLDDADGVAAQLDASWPVHRGLSLGLDATLSGTESGADVLFQSLAIETTYQRQAGLFRPYASIGLGMGHVRGVTAGVKHDQGIDPCWLVSGGVDLVPGKHWSIGIDLGLVGLSGTHQRMLLTTGWRW